MDDRTKTVMLTAASAFVRNGLVALGSAAAAHGIISSSSTETFVSLGMVLAGAAWSGWNSYGRAIVISKLEVLKAKSLAQAAAMRQNGVPPVTAGQIAGQSPTLTTGEVKKVVATLPLDIQANVRPTAGL